MDVAVIFLIKLEFDLNADLTRGHISHDDLVIVGCIRIERPAEARTIDSVIDHGAHLSLFSALLANFPNHDFFRVFDASHAEHRIYK